MQTQDDNHARDFLIIPHTHWEGAVFQTRERYLQIGLPHLLRALCLLKRYPGYRFTLDQVCYLRPFLERYPEEEEAFRGFVREGRLALVGGTHVMPDVNMPGGESFVRQMLLGQGYLREKLGVEVTVGWQLDTFGHHAQMPQLLKLAGYHSFWFMRGVPDDSVPAEFLWEGLDGSRIPAFWLPQTYGNAYGAPASLPDFTEFIQERFDALAPYARGGARVGLAGADVAPPEEHLPALVEAYNRQAGAPCRLSLAVPADFEALAAQRPDQPVVQGELNPLFQGTYSSRIELKQRNREAERLLTTAEKLGVLLRWRGEPVDDEVLERAWEPVLFNHAHDLMSGVMTDRVYEETVGSYDFARRLGEQEVQARLARLASQVDTQGEGLALVVFNALGWPRTDLVTLEVGFSDSDVWDVELRDPGGGRVPVQILSAERHANGALLQAEIAFVARGVPALGYVVYHLRPLRSPAAEVRAAQGPAPGTAIENEYYRVEFGPGGAMTAVTLQGEGWNALAGPGNVVVREEDQGDLWELYHALDAGRRLARTEPHPVPEGGSAVFSDAQTEAPGGLRVGPVVSEFSVETSLGGAGGFSTVVRLYRGVARIDIVTRLTNHESFVRYRVLFPTGIEQGRSVHEIPFGALERPTGIEFPAQNWVDYGDGDRGVALLNRGLPGNAVAGGTLLLSLLRSARIGGYGYSGGYEPGMSSDSGLELGREFVFEYALVPHRGDWAQAGIHRSGWEFNHPLLVCKTPSHPGMLPSRWGWLEVSHPGVVVSALMPGSDAAAVLRLYEATGEQAPGVRISFASPVLSAEEANLLGDPLRPLEVAGDAVQVDFRPFEIKTLKLHLHHP